MGKQSARIYYQGKDHKDIYFNGHYHDAVYIGNQLVWEKLRLNMRYHIFNSWNFYSERSMDSGNGMILGYANDSWIYKSEDGIGFTKVHEIKSTISSTPYIIFLNGSFYIWYQAVGDKEIFIYKTEDGEVFERIRNFTFQTGDHYIVNNETTTYQPDVTPMHKAGNGKFIVRATAVTDILPEPFNHTSGLFVTENFSTFKNITYIYGIDPVYDPTLVRLIPVRSVTDICYHKGFWYLNGTIYDGGEALYTLYKTKDFEQYEKIAYPRSGFLDLGSYVKVGLTFTKDFEVAINELPCLETRELEYQSIIMSCSSGKYSVIYVSNEYKLGGPTYSLIITDTEYKKIEEDMSMLPIRDESNNNISLYSPFKILNLDGTIICYARAYLNTGGSRNVAVIIEGGV